MPGEEIKETLKKAKSLFDSGKIEETRDALEKDLVNYPRDTRILSFLAYVYYKLGDLDRARDTYRRLTGLDTENTMVWSNLGLVSYKMGRYEEAKQAFEEYLKRKPDDPKILSYMGLVLEKMGRSIAAKNYHSRAKTRLEPGEVKKVTEVDQDQEDSVPTETPAVEETHSAAQVVEKERKEGPVFYDEAIPFKEWSRFFDEDKVSGRHYYNISSRIVAVRLENRIYFALPCLTMYRGIVVIEQGINPYGRIPRSYRDDSLVLMAAEGNGNLWLTHSAGWLVTLQLKGEAVKINAHHLVAFESTLECEWIPVGKDRFMDGLACLRLSGDGKVILAAGEGLASSEIERGTPIYIRPSSLVVWTDTLMPYIDKGEDLSKVKGFFSGPFLRFEGAGRIFVTGRTED